MKICDAYWLAEKFVDNMKDLESKDIKFYNMSNYDEWKRYIAIWKLTKRYMSNNKASMIAWALIYALSHPKSYISANKYRSGEFWQPCEMKK